MIIKEIPNGYNSIAEVLQSKEFKEFRRQHMKIKTGVDKFDQAFEDGVPVGSLTSFVGQNIAPSILQLFLKSLEV